MIFDNPLPFLINTLLGLYLCALLLRTALQFTRADFYNPLAQFIWMITQKPVELLQRVIPYWKRVDVAALVLAYVVAAINVWLILALADLSVNPIYLLLLAFLKLLLVTLHLYAFCIFVQALLSWLGPGMHSPASSLLWSITEPLLRPVRQFLPPIGGLDFSPLLVLLVLMVLARQVQVNLPVFLQ